MPRRAGRTTGSPVLPVVPRTIWHGTGMSWERALPALSCRPADGPGTAEVRSTQLTAGTLDAPFLNLSR